MKTTKFIIFFTVIPIMFAGCMLWDVEEVRGNGRNGGDVSIPVITITTQPAAETNVIFDNITGSLSVAASVSNDAIPNYRWYSNTSNTNTSGIAIENATSETFTIPTNLDLGTYYYFCEISAFGAVTIRSNVAVVRVNHTGVIEMVWVPGGSFRMGSPSTEPGRYSNEDYRTANDGIVTMSGFYMGKYQVTQEQWMEVIGEENNPSYFHGGSGREPASGEEQGKRPVENVTWFDAIEFCNKLSQLEDLTPVYTITGRTPATGYPITSATVTANWSANGYRLPTEAQWEYACRAGSTTAWHFGNTQTVLGNYAWYMNNSNSRTHQVGLKLSNDFGLHDMHGNVWEWCWDWYTASYNNAGGNANPLGPTAGTNRLIRGGSWINSAENTRSANRFSDYPGSRYGNVGFRLVRP